MLEDELWPLVGVAEAAPKHDVLWALADLHKQATTDRSHWYTARVVRRAIAEILTLRAATSATGHIA